VLTPGSPSLGDYEAIWRDRIEPGHDIILEALLNKIETALASARKGDDPER
jgi:hypothetical protein